MSKDKQESNDNTESKSLDSNGFIKQDYHTTKTQSFDPLLFNGLGNDRERWWNNLFYGIITVGGILFFVAGLYIFNGFFIYEWYHQNWFLVSCAVIMLTFIIFLVVWCYVHILIFKHTRKNKNIDKSNPLIICEYQGSFINYCVWILGSIIMLVWYVPLMFLGIIGIVTQSIIAPILTHLYLSKPFLLKRILLFEDCVVLEYRIFGNIKLSRENLALMRLPRTFDKISDFIYANTAFVRPVLFENVKDPYFIANFCIRFNSFGMNNIDKLWEELDSKMGYSIEKMAGRRELVSKNKKFNILDICINNKIRK